jgi:6-phospho-3-hexuloisomerase
MQTRNLIEAILDSLSGTFHQVDPGQIDVLRNAILKANRIFIAGKGRTGLQMRAFAMRLMQLGLQVHVLDDVTTPSIQAGDLLIIGSASGRTASLVRFAAEAQYFDATVSAIVGDRASPIAASANSIVIIPATNFKSGEQFVQNPVLVMGSLFEHTLGLLCDLITIQLKAVLNVSESDMNARHANLE